MKTSELTGPALDWAVAKCEGHEVHISNGGWVVFDTHQDDPPPVNEYNDSRWQRYYPSFDWSQAGPIIEREIITLIHPRWDGWTAHKYDEHDDEESYTLDGPTPLVAAMRCYVASKLGDEVDVPGELTA